MDNPFKPAEQEKRNLKLVVFGDYGVGKTTFALRFPKICFIDLEKGSSLYGGKFKFDKVNPKNCQEVEEIIDFLMRGGCTQYETLVIDPITMLWEMLQRKWSDIFLRRNAKSPGNKHEFYENQPKDWATMKSDWKDTMNNIISLPLNIICIAREKAEYAPGGFMQKVGETFDCEKNLPYLFDTVVRIVWQNEKRMCLVKKDRSNTLPEAFELDYSYFQRIIDGQLPEEKKPIPVDPDAWLDQKVGFDKTGELTWRDLISDVTLPDGVTKGLSYLQKLADWKAKPKIAEKAAKALEMNKPVSQNTMANIESELDKMGTETPF